MKNKIGFAVGLLAVLFTLTPVINDLEKVAFIFLGLSLSIKTLYWVLATTLGLSVYCYGLQFTLYRHRLPTILGDIFYVVGLVAPLLYLFLYIIDAFIDLLNPLLQSERLLSFLQVGLAASAGAVSTVIAYRARQILSLKTRQAERQLRQKEEDALLSRATTLLKEDHFDLAVIEAFRALEIAARERFGLLGNDRRKSDWFGLLLSNIPQDLRPLLEVARAARNNAAHAVESISEMSAKEAVVVISKVMALLSDSKEECCDECGSKNLIEESGVDHGFHWTRKRCGKCGYIDLS